MQISSTNTPTLPLFHFHNTISLKLSQLVLLDHIFVLANSLRENDLNTITEQNAGMLNKFRLTDFHILKLEDYFFHRKSLFHNRNKKTC